MRRHVYLRRKLNKHALEIIYFQILLRSQWRDSPFGM